MLLIFRPFKVGDFISIDGQDGSVVEIDLFTTSLNTLDNRRVILPNKVVFGQTMQNFSANEQRRVDIDVGVTYSADLDETRKALTAAAATVTNQDETLGAEIYLVNLVLPQSIGKFVSGPIQHITGKSAKTAPLPPRKLSTPPASAFHSHKWMSISTASM